MNTKMKGKNGKISSASHLQIFTNPYYKPKFSDYFPKNLLLVLFTDGLNSGELKTNVV